MPQVDFYVLQAETSAARWHFAARLCEKALGHGLRAGLVLPSEAALAELSDALWQLRPEAFLPHSQGFDHAHPIALLTQSQTLELPEAERTLLINFHQAPPPGLMRFARVAEIVIQEAAVLAQTRALFASYRKQGLQPATHRL